MYAGSWKPAVDCAEEDKKDIDLQVL